MDLLIDTHIWLWAILEPERIKPNVRAAMRTEENSLWLSPISVWEALMLSEKGRIQLGRSPTHWIEQAVRTLNAGEAVLTHEIALQSRALPLPHSDPSDRFLVATAKVMGLHMVTADEKILKAKVCLLFKA